MQCRLSCIHCYLPQRQSMKSIHLSIHNKYKPAPCGLPHLEALSQALHHSRGTQLRLSCHIEQHNEVGCCRYQSARSYSLLPAATSVGTRTSPPLLHHERGTSCPLSLWWRQPCSPARTSPSARVLATRPSAKGSIPSNLPRSPCAYGARAQVRRDGH